MLSATRITLLVASKCFEHHKTSFGTMKTYDMLLALTKPISSRCLEYVSSTRMFEYQQCALDQWNSLSDLTKELNVSSKKRCFIVLPTIFKYKYRCHKGDCFSGFVQNTLSCMVGVIKSQIMHLN